MRRALHEGQVPRPLQARAHQEVLAAHRATGPTEAFTGAILPLLLERVRIDPALAGGVILTTVTDVVGFVSFLGLASVFLVDG